MRILLNILYFLHCIMIVSIRSMIFWLRPYVVRFTSMVLKVTIFQLLKCIRHFLISKTKPARSQKFTKLFAIAQSLCLRNVRKGLRRHLITVLLGSTWITQLKDYRLFPEVSEVHQTEKQVVKNGNGNMEALRIS